MSASASSGGKARGGGGGAPSPLFVSSAFRTYVSIEPHEITPAVADRILVKLREKYEARCTRFGYVRAGSLEVTKCGDGVLERQMFNGSVRFNVACRAMVARPMPGHVLVGALRERTKAGWVVWVRDEDAEPTAAPQPPLVVVASIPNDGADGQSALPPAAVGSRVRLKVLRNISFTKNYASVIGRMLRADPADERAAGDDAGPGAVSRPGAIPEELGDDDDDAAAPAPAPARWGDVEDADEADGDAEGAASESASGSGSDSEAESDEEDVDVTDDDADADRDGDAEHDGEDD